MPAGRRGRRPRTRGSAPLEVFSRVVVGKGPVVYVVGPIARPLNSGQVHETVAPADHIKQLAKKVPIRRVAAHPKKNLRAVAVLTGISRV
jgi:hypothetical protein